MPAKKKSSKVSSENKDRPYVEIPQDLKNAEHERCSAWNGEEDDCKSNDCWYQTRSKKCQAHYGKMVDKMSTKKKRSKKRSKSRSKSKKSKHGGTRRSNMKRKSKRRSNMKRRSKRVTSNRRR
jgi:hypothetical protein